MFEVLVIAHARDGYTRSKRIPHEIALHYPKDNKK
jgi:hypothetical protein